MERLSFLEPPSIHPSIHSFPINPQNLLLKWDFSVTQREKIQQNNIAATELMIQQFLRNINGNAILSDLDCVCCRFAREQEDI